MVFDSVVTDLHENTLLAFCDIFCPRRALKISFSVCYCSERITMYRCVLQVFDGFVHEDASLGFFFFTRILGCFERFCDRLRISLAWCYTSFMSLL